MENQIPASQVPMESIPAPGPVPSPTPIQGQITLEQLEEMKARAREIAVQQTLNRSAAPYQPKVVYIRRNLTVAELILVFLLSSGVVLGIQGVAYLATNYLPRIEIKVK